MGDATYILTSISEMQLSAEARMGNIGARFVGVELYFDDLAGAKNFYAKTLGLAICEDDPSHHAKFDTDAGFICLEKKGVENYPSRDKAVLFFEVADLSAAIAAVGKERVVHSERGWAVLHDPEGHNILLLEPNSGSPTGRTPLRNRP
jgi:predicted enzyme related to lactoylglutathione lyase